MKRLLLILLTVTALVFSGCMDLFEEIRISENGSGTYVTSVNMGGAMEMIEMFAASAGESDEGKEVPDFFKKDIDTVMRFNDFMQGDKEITEEKKELYKDAIVRIINNKENKIFKVSVSVPFSSIDNLNRVVKSFEDGKGMESVIDPILGKEKMGEENAELPGSGSHGTTTFGAGFIQREMNKSMLDSLKNSPDKPNFEGQDELMESMKFSTEISLPRPIKSFTGKKIKVSEDKRKVTINTSLKDLVEDPMSMAFRIDY